MAVKTYRELILDIENACKRQANLERWPQELLIRELGRVQNLREILKDHLDHVPEPNARDLSEVMEEVARRVER